MKSFLFAIAFPFILIFAMLGALIARPFRLRVNEKDGLEIGIFPLVLIIIILSWIF